MPSAPVQSALGCLLALAACSATGPVPNDLAALLEQAAEGNPARLGLDGTTIVAAAIPLGPGSLPASVRLALEAVAPGGELLLQAREWGPRGNGYRIEKRYREGGQEHLRSTLIDAEGRVLERAHTVPIGEAPQHVLAGAMQTGQQIETLWIVAGPEHEEYWACTVHDRLGRTYVTKVGLDGRRLSATRQVQARVGW